MPRLMNTWPEALHFIQQTRFDTSVTEAFKQNMRLSSPPVEDVITASARRYQAYVGNTKPTTSAAR